MELHLEILPVSVPTAKAGWHLAYGYSERPFVLWAREGQTQWRMGPRLIPITHYAGPIVPERSAK